MDYASPGIDSSPRLNRNQVLSVASGDLRPRPIAIAGPRNRRWKKSFGTAVADRAMSSCAAHPYRPDEGHGFISSQKEGMAVFAGIDPKRR